MRIPWDSYEHRNVCESGEIMIMTPLIRNYKKEKKVEAGGWKILGREKARERGEKQENTRKLRETKGSLEPNP